jgi:hypothetical protein
MFGRLIGAPPATVDHKVSDQTPTDAPFNPFAKRKGRSNGITPSKGHPASTVATAAALHQTGRIAEQWARRGGRPFAPYPRRPTHVTTYCGRSSLTSMGVGGLVYAAVALLGIGAG